ncbi:hypothetical protein [Brucella anthropi]|uniref:hypothetical protein n=1 Tax=Brucella anthropi TaxID=529 RepID=UPI003D982E1C
MKALTENQAVLNPAKAMTASKRVALLAVGFYRYQRRYPNGAWMIGRSYYAASTVSALIANDLVRCTARGELELTLGGKLAYDKLKGNHNGPR